MTQATMSTLNFILFMCYKGTAYFAVPSMIIAKFYSNTMLLALNSRVVIIGGRDDPESNTDYPYGIQNLSQWELRNDSGPMDLNFREGNNAGAWGDAITVESEPRFVGASLDQYTPNHESTKARNNRPEITKPANSFYQKQ